MVTNSNAATVGRAGTSKKADDSATWLTRNEASDLLGVSQMTLLAMERREQLHPRRVMRLDNGGHQRAMYVYDPRELAKLPHRGRAAALTPGEIAARCFELLDDGRPLKEIVRELREPPEKIEDLYERWLNMGGADYVITPEVKDAIEKHTGPFTDLAGLIELVAKLKTAPKP